MKIAIKQSFKSSAEQFDCGTATWDTKEQDDFQADLQENQIQHSGKNENFLVENLRVGITLFDLGIHFEIQMYFQYMTGACVRNFDLRVQ